MIELKLARFLCVLGSSWFIFDQKGLEMFYCTSGSADMTASRICGAVCDQLVAAKDYCISVHDEHRQIPLFF
jgi:hypothetical protein